MILKSKLVRFFQSFLRTTWFLTLWFLLVYFNLYLIHKYDLCPMDQRQIYCTSEKQLYWKTSASKISFQKSFFSLEMLLAQINSYHFSPHLLRQLISHSLLFFPSSWLNRPTYKNFPLHSTKCRLVLLFIIISTF